MEDKIICKSIDYDGIKYDKFYQCAIYSTSKEIALKKLKEISEKIGKKQKNFLLCDSYCLKLFLNNGYEYSWINPKNHSRRRDFSEAMIDKSVTIEQLYEDILPNLIHCEEGNIIFF